MKTTVDRKYHMRIAKELKELKQAANRVRDAWLRGGAKTEDMKAACTCIDMCLKRRK